MRDDKAYLHHILDAIERVQLYVTSVTYEAFTRNLLLQDGVVRQLQIVGEAARQISDAFRHAHPELPWSAMIGMRNRLTHAYFEVNLPIVWDTIHFDLPPLKEKIERILAEDAPK